MTIKSIVELLKKSGINSKKLAIDLLENASEKELLELARDCNRIVAEKRVRKGKNNG